jgi:hypothetical protein
VSDERPCPNCGEPVEGRQLVCLNCGARVALAEKRSWANEPVTAIAAALMAVIVIGAGLFGFAIAELTGDDGDDGGQAAQAQNAPGSGEAPAVVSGEGQEAESSPRTALPPDTTATAPAETAPAETTPPTTAETGELPGWPAGLTAHTVVLVSSSDGPAARKVARGARRSGLEAGLFRSDPYNLGTGLWIVYSGRFDTREGAARQAAGLQDRYPGAYPQLVQSGQ